MHHIPRIVTGILATAFAAVLHAQAQAPDLPYVVVGNITIADGVARKLDPQQLASLEKAKGALPRLLTAAVVAGGKFNAFERAVNAEAAKEADITGGTVALSQANYILGCQIVDFQDRIKTASTGGYPFSVGLRKRVVTLHVTGALIDARTNAVLTPLDPRAIVLDADSETPAGVTQNAQSDETLITRASEAAAKKIACRAADWLYPVLVIDRSGDEVTINRGDRTDIGDKDEAGQVRYEVRLPGKKLTDPSTGRSIEVAGGKVGVVEILSVQPAYATGKVISETKENAIITGCVLQRLLPARSSSAAR